MPTFEQSVSAFWPSNWQEWHFLYLLLIYIQARQRNRARRASSIYSLAPTKWKGILQPFLNFKIPITLSTIMSMFFRPGEHQSNYSCLLSYYLATMRTLPGNNGLVAISWGPTEHMALSVCGMPLEFFPRSSMVFKSWLHPSDVCVAVEV